MNGVPEQGRQREAWQRAIAEVDALAAAVRVLWQDRAATLTMLESALHGIRVSGHRGHEIWRSLDEISDPDCRHDLKLGAQAV